MDVDLYAVPLDEFVPARKALAARLRAGGAKEEAKTAAALRKPTAAAWIVNQLVHGHPRLVDEFRAAAAAARSAQAALAGGDRTAWPAASAALKQAQQALVDVAGTLGAGPAALEKAAGTLTAAAADGAVEAVVLGGRLLKEVAPGGFDGLLAEDIPLLPRAAAGSAPAVTATDRNRRGAAQVEVARAGAEGPAAAEVEAAAGAEATAEAEAAAEADARAAAEAAEQAAAQAEAEAEAAAERLRARDKARAVLSAAEARRQAAARDEDAARRRLADATAARREADADHAAAAAALDAL
ncbi:hypothetical protein DSM112329_01868 [Paraconexibacter sp. AEG42_29]|uniref:Transposase n=1 Tax=Paraconexibacter sp. AEG42_29 TaxID=2997339 RepID=A0AAU7ATM3_9ACTN